MNSSGAVGGGNGHQGQRNYLFGAHSFWVLRRRDEGILLSVWDCVTAQIGAQQEDWAV